MSLNDQNDLEFEHKMHYGDSNYSQKFCQNFSKMMTFWLKIRIFLNFTARFPFLNFQRKNYLVPGKWSN